MAQELKMSTFGKIVSGGLLGFGTAGLVISIYQILNHAIDSKPEKVISLCVMWITCFIGAAAAKYVFSPTKQVS